MKFREPIALVAPVRTPIGKIGGRLAQFEPYELLANSFRGTLFRYFNESMTYHSILERELSDSGVYRVTKEMLERADEDPSFTTALVAEDDQETLEKLLASDEVIAGSVRNGMGNVARVAALEAGVPIHVPAMTIDRQCGASLEALVTAAAKINAGLASKILVGGVESASRAPWLYERPRRENTLEAPRPFRVRLSTDEFGDPGMAESVEELARDFRLSRAQMDEFALESHRKATQAHARGEFTDEIWAFAGNDDGGMVALDPDDECVRSDTSLDALASLPTAFDEQGALTAGNSSPHNDGAASCLAMSAQEVELDGLRDIAWLSGYATVALEPRMMGLGPAVAIPKLLRDQGLEVEDIDLFEINEAFAAQVLATLTALGMNGCLIPREKLNVNGGAIALGHPLGASGLRLVVTLVHALRHRGLKRGVASLCIGGGQGMAVLVEIP